ncbi:MAG: lysine--tRNA ligase [Patescibacteria group bacterium]|jgi:lysyl-tRNA synthetase class 2
MENIDYLDEETTRKQKLEKLRELTETPYPSVVHRSHIIKSVLNDFKSLEEAKQEIVISGRLRSIRKHGGSTFAHLEDESGKIQIYLRKDIVGDKPYSFFGDIVDVGDFIVATGTAFVTKKGESTILVSSFELISKALMPLPEKWHGLKDIETRYRKRYLDLLSNDEVKKIFVIRSKVVQFIRNYFTNEGFVEVDTPILQQVASGAIAKPFKTHHNALNTDLYLRIAPEIYLKELIVGGFEKVFEIARCFRNEGIDYSHNPEFTQIEFYWAYKDYKELMKFTEQLLFNIVKEVTGSAKLSYNNSELDFTPPYNKVDYREALISGCGVDLDEYDESSIVKIAKEKGLRVEKEWGKGKIADELFKKFVRPTFINPTFIINHPIELSPLAKQIPGRPNYVERFQIVVGGAIELCNAYSELNDPIEQEERFKHQSQLTKKGDEEAMKKDDEFVEALKYGMPPTAGFGMGIDRLVNVITNTHSIKEVILFPTLKPE